MKGRNYIWKLKKKITFSYCSTCNLFYAVMHLNRYCILYLFVTTTSNAFHMIFQIHREDTPCNSQEPIVHTVQVLCCFIFYIFVRISWDWHSVGFCEMSNYVTELLNPCDLPYQWLYRVKFAAKGAKLRVCIARSWEGQKSMGNYFKHLTLQTIFNLYIPKKD
jgi:hypothetical protein